MEPGPGRRVASIHVYPFKSAGGISMDAVRVDAVGLEGDRRWMAVDLDGRFVSQRTHPRMALLRTSLTADMLELAAAGTAPLRLPRAEPDPDEYGLHRVWFSDRYAVDCGDEAARWMGAFLGTPARVVRAVRPADRPHLTDEGRVQAGFADASPALVVSSASLADLNARLERPLSMNRFRPNLVVEGFAAFEEDRWGRKTIGAVPTHGGRPCPRCATTLVDQDTAERGVEPLRTLADFRRNPSGEVEFGVNVFFDARGTIRVGDPVA